MVCPLGKGLTSSVGHQKQLGESGWAGEGGRLSLYGRSSGGSEAKKGQLDLKGTVESLGIGKGTQDFLQWSGQRGGKGH